MKLIANCSTEKIYEYIRQAHINVLPTFQATGIKLKLLAALFNGRHCVVNSPMIAGTGLEGLCHICDSAPVMQQKITTLFNEEFNITQLEMRNQLLQELFSTQKTALKIVELIRSL